LATTTIIQSDFAIQIFSTNHVVQPIVDFLQDEMEGKGRVSHLGTCPIC